MSDSESDEQNIPPVLPASIPLKSGKIKTKKLNYDPTEGRNSFKSIQHGAVRKEKISKTEDIQQIHQKS